MAASQGADELRALARASVEELDSWLSQEIQDELGTRAYILRAIAWCRRGALARARADVDAALAKVPAHELVELTGALILYVTRDYDRALALLEGVARRHRYMAAQTLRVLVARAARLGWTADQREAQRALAELGVRDLRAHIQGLQASRGARPGASVEAEGERAWARLGEHGPEDVGARLEALEARAPGSVVVRGLLARLAMVCGRLDEAARLLGDDTGPLDERMALALARGELEAVTRRRLDASASARAWRVRGEALLELATRLDPEASERARHLDAASEALARAAEREPDNAITELLRALVASARGEADPSAGRRFVELYALAPGLLSDAARELALPLWVDGGMIDDRAQLGRICERARTLLTADRSSSPISYRTVREPGEDPGTARLRHLADPAVARATHAADAVDLGKAAQLLLRSIERGRKGRGAHRAASGRSLDAAQIEGFMADGYVHLRGAFPRALAESIVASAHRRLREDPARWLGGREVERRAAKLRGYDPEDPKTWPQGRLDVLGERSFTISEFSPFAERAVFQLLGDAARVRTRSWTSNLIAQYPYREPLRDWVPEPDQESWHLDSPSTHTRIDELRTGLLVFILFSDLSSAGGNSWLALDSPAKVARALAAAPEGVDFCHDDAGSAITRTCERFFEVTGEAGDLLLVHPLMLHSASPNPSTRIRFLGNPMVYLQAPLDHRRADPSPVERVIARALE
ncbi:hypothetical protein ENSA5_03770 [Enhygromyxa salina]|uniref:Phytanoyl-CoA dioxygenase (PhyH) n=1 Tax=Enhygromyxa salina TaxID=215803 RepID=A0A2S9YJH1_9BACT|nr:phytanoyl-CoA dioxygenase family protein [Enhygromyxa salina]PRQ05258.1 hypothetical protein ENSA5_03770 [Enhygromyxa salina]